MEKDSTALAPHATGETGYIRYIFLTACALLFLALAHDVQKHYAAHTRVVFDSEGLTVPVTPPPQNVCDALEQRALKECDIMMENTWYDGGDFTYSRQQHLKDFSRCQTLSSNIFQACSLYGQ